MECFVEVNSFCAQSSIDGHFVWFQSVTRITLCKWLILCNIARHCQILFQVSSMGACQCSVTQQYAWPPTTFIRNYIVRVFLLSLPNIWTCVNLISKRRDHFNFHFSIYQWSWTFIHMLKDSLYLLFVSCTKICSYILLIFLYFFTFRSF